MRQLSEFSVRLVVPNDASYLRMVRLVVASIGVDAEFSVDRVEDLKLVVDEFVSLAMASAAVSSAVSLGVERQSEGIAVRICALLANESAPVTAPPTLDVLSRQIVDALVLSSCCEVVDGSMQIEFVVAPTTNSTDG